MIKSGTETLVTLALISEVRARLGAQAEEVLVSVGERIGDASRFDVEGSLPDFLLAINDLWSELGLGEALLDLGPDGLAIRHILPVQTHDGAADGLWYEALPSIIEGIYKGWFHHLSPQGLLTRKAGSGREVEFFFSE